jgi:hypothetical protein
MIKKILLNISIALPIVFSSINAQDADPIEAARQAKLAAEKAAADAEAATGAAIEAAAAKAAAAAREKVIADREAEKARKLAEKEAAENAEIDAAAEAAALEARRKLAAELGLELEEVPDSSISKELTTMDSSIVDDSLETSPLTGFKIGIAPSVGYFSGATFTSIPIGATAVITTPFGFKVGPFDYTVSISLGGYAGKYESEKDDEFVLGEGETHSVNKFNPMIFGLGGNLTLINLIFAEGHIGIVGEGFGLRGFTGVSLEYLMKKGLNLPFNVLVGGELFYSSDMAGAGNPSGWLSLGARLDYAF